MYGLAVLKIRPVKGSLEAHPFIAKISNGSSILSFIVVLQLRAYVWEKSIQWDHFLALQRISGRDVRNDLVCRQWSAKRVGVLTSFGSCNPDSTIKSCTRSSRPGVPGNDRQNRISDFGRTAGETLLVQPQRGPTSSLGPLVRFL